MGHPVCAWRKKQRETFQKYAFQALCEPFEIHTWKNVCDIVQRNETEKFVTRFFVDKNRKVMVDGRFNR